MVWSKDYKKSIDCDNPKGFSQKSHCSARKKRQRGEETKSKSPFNEMHEVKSHKTVEQIAKKHRMDVSFVKNQLKMGIPIEHEHTKDKDLATDIALQHLDEIPDYYTRLKKMESSAKKEHKKFKDVKEEFDSILEGRRDNKGAGDPDYSLSDWFKGGGWIQVAGKYKGKPCAKQPGQKTKPFCRDADDAAAMSTAEKKRRTTKKRKEDPNPNRTGKAKMIKASYQPDGQQLDELWGKVALAAGAAAVPYLMKKYGKPAVDKAIDSPATGSGTLVDRIKKRRDATNSAIQSLEKNSFELEGEIIDEKKDACYHKVKSRYKVWPSAYASGALVKCRKVGASSWGTKSEAVEMIRYCPKCEKNESRSECKYGTRYWDTYSMPISLGKKYTPNTPHPGNMPEGYDHEYSMARSELSTIIAAAKRLRKKMKGEGNIEAWVQSKITKAADYLDSAADYVDSGEHNVDEAKKCWPGYEKKGTQKLFGKTYNRCVKNEQFSNWREELIILEKWEDKLKNMTPDQIEKLKKSNPGAAEKIDAMRKQAKSATPKPVGSGSQLPNTPKPPATQNRGQNLRDPRAQDRMSAARRQASQIVSAAQAKRAAKTAAKPSLLKTLSKVKNPRVAIPLAIAGGIYGLLTSPKKQQKEDYSNWKEEMGLSEDWQSANRKDGVDGLSQSTVNKYRRENPGSNLQTAVTEKNPKGKRADRRSNFCSRMKGHKAKNTSAKTARDPDSRINKALRRWNCN
jgi:hypothetical protein